MGWFGSKRKRKSPYLSDTGDWHFAALYKHDISLAIAKLDRSHMFEIRNEQAVGRPLGDWEARGLVHFAFDGPLIPFQLSIGGPCHGEERLGHFHVERIQPYNNPNYPEDRKENFLRLAGHIGDASGGIADMLEKAMHDAAISGNRYLHVRLGKEPSDPDAAAAQMAEKQYTDSTAITRFVVGQAIQLRAPGVALAWDDL
jgi:hypothetical protein